MKRLKSLIGLGLGAMLFVGTCQVTVPKKAWAWFFGGAEGKIVETIAGVTFVEGNIDELMEEFIFTP